MRSATTSTGTSLSASATYFALAFDREALVSERERGAPGSRRQHYAARMGRVRHATAHKRRLPSREIQLGGDADRVGEFIDVFQAGRAARA
jgi:hypothetical protein